MTPAEQELVTARQQARERVLAKMADPEAPPIDEDDVKYLTPDEAVRVVNAGRVPDVGRDKRIARRAASLRSR